MVGQRRRPGEQDLETALVGILGVLARERVAPGGGEQGLAVALDQPDGGGMRPRVASAFRIPAFAYARHGVAMIVSESRVRPAQLRKVRRLCPITRFLCTNRLRLVAGSLAPVRRAKTAHGAGRSG
jgi:hypothetical protein